MPAADNDLASVFAVPTEIGAGDAEPPAAATAVAQPTPSRSPTPGTDSVETTGLTAFAPASLDYPAPSTVSRHRTVCPPGLAGVQQQHLGLHPLLSTMALGPSGPVDHLSGGLTPRCDPCSCRLVGPDRVNTVRLDRAKPVGTPPLRRTPPLGDTPPAPSKLDALGDAAELQFVDSVARYSHADWKREQQVEPTCHAAMRYITIGRPSALPAYVLPCYPSHK